MSPALIFRGARSRTHFAYALVLAVLLAALLGRAAAPTVPSNRWANTGSMKVARVGAAGALLLDGSMLVTGGLDASGLPSLTAERYVPSTGMSVSVPSMPTPRANHTATRLADGRVLVAGGQDRNGRALGAAELYDPTVNAWIALPSMNLARSGHTATLLSGGRVFIAGGDDAGLANNSIELYDPYNARFVASTSTLTSVRTGHATALLNDGRVFITGGFNGSTPLNSTNIYNPTTDIVVAGPALLQARAGHTATTLLDGTVLIAAGAGTAGELATAERFNAVTGVITATGRPLITARQRHQAILLPHANEVLIVGGSAATRAVATAELFVPWQSGGSFFATTSPAAARTWAVSGALSLPEAMSMPGPYNGLALLAGGSAKSDGSRPLSSAELYGFATIATDAYDYMPGRTVTMTGAGWVPGETVTLTMVEVPFKDTHPLNAVVADGGGNIISTEFAPDVADLDIAFYLTATGSRSQAQTVFNDSYNAGKLTVAVVPSGLGSVSSSVGGISGCTSTCSNTTSISAGANVTLSASPVGGYQFLHWGFTSTGTAPGSNTCTSANTSSTCSFNAPSGSTNTMTVTASFGIDATITPATGGSAISADTVGGAWTALTGPAIAESLAGTIGTGTIILNAPTGFVFDTATTPSVTLTGGDATSTSNINDWVNNSAHAVSITASQITLTITAASAVAGNTLAWSSIRVRPSAGTPLASGNLTASGTSVISGVTSSTNFGTLTEVAGAAAKLAFTTQPSSSTGGTALATQPVVKVQDASGNTVTTATNAVTLAIGTNPGSGALSAATNPLSATAGIASFSGVSIDKSGTGYTLTASAVGLTGATSSTFNITVGPATKLAFTTQPAGGSYPNQLLPTQPVVNIQDAGGNRVTTATSTVTLGIGTNPGGATLSATTNPLVAAAGIASFSGVSLSASGTGYTLTASATGLGAATSDAFNVAPDPSTKLAFVQQPTAALPNTTIIPPVTVELEDVNGARVTSSTAPVTLALASGPSATLSGTLTRSAVNGLATFSDLRVNNLGTGYSLAAASGTLTGATSASFSIVSTLGACNWNTTTSDLWTVSGRWSCGHVPTGLDAVTIAQAGATVTVPSGVNAVAASLTLGTNAASSSSLTFTDSTTTLTVSGDLVVNGQSSGTTAFTRAVNVNAGALVVHGNVSLAAGEGTTQTNHITKIVATTGSVQVDGSVTMNGRVAAQAVIDLSAGAAVLTFGGGFSVNSVAGGMGTLTPGTSSTVNFASSTVAQTIPTGVTTVTYRNLNVNNTSDSGATLGAAITSTKVTGSLQVQSGTLSNGGFSVAGAAGATLLVAGGATLSLSGTSAFPSGFGTITLQTGSTVAYVGTTQTVSARTYSNLTIAGSGTKTVGGSTTVGNTLTLTSSVLAGSSTVSVTSTSASAIVRTSGWVSAPLRKTFAAGTAQSYTFPIGDASNYTPVSLQNLNVGVGGTITASTAANDTVLTGHANSQVVTTADVNRSWTLTAAGGLTTTGFDGTFDYVATDIDAGSIESSFVVRDWTGSTWISPTGGTTVDSFNHLVSGTGFTALGIFGVGTPLAPTRLVITGSTTQTAGYANNLTITARDASNNTIAVYSGDRVLTFSGANDSTSPVTAPTIADKTGGAVAFGNPTTLTFVNGVATVSSASNGVMTLYQVETAVIAASDGTTTSSGADQLTVAVGAGSLAKFGWSLASPQTNGVAFSGTNTLTAHDAYGNAQTAFNASTDDVVIGANSPLAGAVSGLSGGTRLSSASDFVSGVANLTMLGLKYTGASGAGTFTATSSTTQKTGTSAAVTINSSAATNLQFIEDPTTTVSNSAVNPAVTVGVFDASGNVVTSDNATKITLTITSGSGTSGAVLTGGGQTTVSGGIATFSGLSIDKAGLAYSLSAADTTGGGSPHPFASDVSAEFDIVAATLDHFLVEAAGGGAIGTQTAGTPFNIRITAQDATNNTATAFTSTVTLTSTGSLSGSPLTSAAFTAGVLTSQSVTVTNTGSFTITATATPKSGTSASFSVNPGAATHLSFNVQPSSAVAGATISPAVTVRLLDAHNNLVTGDSVTTVQLAIGTNPGGGTLTGGGSIAVVSGVATFSGLSIDKAGTGYTLVASSPSAPSLITATSSTFNITAGLLDHFLVEASGGGAVGSQIAGTPFNIRITAQDAHNNIVSSFTSTAAVTSSGTLTGSPITTGAFTAGVLASQSVTITSIGSTTISAAASGKSGTSVSFTVDAGSLDHFLVEATGGGAIGAQTAGTPFNVRITARDVNNNTVISFTSIATLTSSGTLAGSPLTTGTFSAGVLASQSVTITSSGSTTVTATSGGKSGTGASFSVSAGAPTRVAFAVEAANTVAGAVISPAVTIRVLDAYGNVVVTDNTTKVTLGLAINPGSGTLTGGAQTTVSSGTATFSGLSINKTGAGYALSAADTTGTSGHPYASDTSVLFAVTPGAATHLAFGQEPSNAVAALAIAPAITVSVVDANNNVVTTDSSTSVTLAIGTNPGSGTLTGGGATTVSAGIATFSSVSINRTGTGYTLTASSSPSLTGATSNTFDITSSAATHLGFGQQPTSAVAGSAISPAVTVQVLDGNNNVVTGDSATQVTLAIGTNPGSGSLTGGGVTTVSSGVATFSGVSVDKAGAGYTLTASSTPVLTGVSSSTFTITAGTVNAGHSTVSASPTSVTATGVSSSAVTVTLKDVNDNPVSGKIVTLAKSGGSSTITTVIGTTGASGQATFTVTDTVAESATYTATDTTDTVVVTQTTSISFIAGSANASHSTTSASPTSVPADGTTTSTITVTLKDVNDNPVSGKTVTLAKSGGNSTIATVSGTTSSAGQATFTVTDSTAESTTYMATDTSDTMTVTQTASVTFRGAPNVTSIVAAAANPSSASSVSWTVTFNESVTGVTSSTFSLVNTGLGGTPAIATVTGSGTTYTVTAGTGTGSGTLQLNAVADANVKNTLDLALVTGATGAPYTVDRTGPTTATVTNPIDDAAYTGATGPRPLPTSFSGLVADNTGGAGLPANSSTFTLRRAAPDTYYWTGNGWQASPYPLATTHVATTSGTSVTWSSAVSWPIWTTLPDDQELTVQVTATDALGNSTAGPAITFELDYSTPLVTIESLSATYTKTGTTVTWHATTTHNDTGVIGTYSVRIGGTSCTDGTEVTGTNTSGSYTALAQVATAITGGLSEGANLIRVCVINPAGTAGFQTTAVSKDTTAPITASVAVPIDGQIYTNLNMMSAFSGTAADNVNGVGLAQNTTTFTLQRASDNQYWSGIGWQGSPYPLPTTHAATASNAVVTWTSSVALPTWGNETPHQNFTVVATATDALGNSPFTGSPSTFHLDYQLPIVTIESVTTPTTSGTTVVWHADTSGTYSVRLGGTGCSDGTVPGSPATNTSGSYTTPTQITTTIPSAALPEGTTTIRVCVVNAIFSTGVATTSVTKDSTNPSVATLTSPVGGHLYSGSNAPNPLPSTFSGSAADNTAGIGLNANSATFTLRRSGPDSYYWTGGGWQASPSPLATTHASTSNGSTVTWTSAVTLPTWDSEADNQDYTVQVTVTDKAGNTLTGSTATFHVDFSVPVVTIESVTPSYTRTSATVAWHSDSTGTYSLRVNGTCSSGVLPTGTNVSGSYTTASPTPPTVSSTITGGLSEGSNSVLVCVTDSMPSTGSATTTVTRDTTAPQTSSVTSPVNGFVYNAQGVPTFSGIAADAGSAGLNANSTTFTLQRASDSKFWTGSGDGSRDSGWQVGTHALPTTHTATTTTASTSWVSAASMPVWSNQADDQDFTVQATVTDRAGNTLSGPAASFELDYSLPNVTIDSSPSITSSGATVTWHADRDGNYGVYVGGASCGTGTAVQPGAPSLVAYTANESVQTAIAAGTLTQGVNTVRICITDDASNVGSAVTSITKDAVAPPTAAFISPANGAKYNLQTVPSSFSGAVADDGAGTGLLANSTTFTLQRLNDGLYWTGSTWQSGGAPLATTHVATTAATAATWTAAVSLPSWSGEADHNLYEIRVTMTDRAGNSSTPFSGFAGFELDYTVPVVTIDSAPALTTLGATLTWHADEDGPYSVTVNGSAECTGGTVVASGTYLPPTPLATSVSGSQLAEGSNVVRVCLVDSGSTYQASAAVTITKDSVAPWVTNVTSTAADGAYGVGAVIPILVQFSEPVTVIGTPQLTVATRSTPPTAIYASGSGTNALTFTYVVSAGESSADLDYTATTALSANGALLADAAGNAAALTLQSPGASGSLGANKAIVIAAVLVADHAVLTYPLTVPTKTSTAQTVTLTNDGDGTLSISSIALDSSVDYTITGGTCSTGSSTLSANASCTLLVVFAPKTSGPKVAHIVVTHDSAGSPQAVVTLTGTGSAWGPLAYTLLSTPLGTNGGNRLLTFYNISGAPIAIDHLSFSSETPNQFIFAADTCTGKTVYPTPPSNISKTDPSVNCTLTMAFTPTMLGLVTGQFTVTDTNSVTYVWGVQGTATIPIAASPASLSFGSVARTTASTRTVTLSNATSQPTTITTLAVTGDYAVTANRCTANVVPAGSNCSLDVTFTPTATGTRTGTLTISSSYSSDVKITLTGTGL